MSDTLTAVRAPRTRRPLRHIRGPLDLDRPLTEQLLAQAAAYEAGEAAGLPRRVLATIFYEPSTRTRFSFESAMLRLGGQVISAENATKASSAIKGESLEDTIRIISGYADAIVLRHPEIGAADRAARAADVPIINAGDGAGHHPTQALLDLYTIKKELGRLDHLRVGLVGDLRHGRTVRSLALLLSMFPGTDLTLVSPGSLTMEQDVLSALTARGVRYAQGDRLAEVVPALDVLYQTRIQAERFESPESYERHRGVYVIDPAVMRRLPDHAILMHPMPRVGEIDPAVDDDPRAAYFRQAKNGLVVRMAVLAWAMGS
ncbi:MAG: aspartate carbamoyltransferase [Candidatus Dormibacteraeota bacterium]|nr:aspartate carbamoyltransferase [Candidatus Dormibacteraeota bacterium]